MRAARSAARPAARATSRARREDGLTLAELLVTVGILTVVLTVALSSSLTLFRSSQRVEERNLNADQARLGVAALSQDLRAATPPVGMAATQVIFPVAEPSRAVFYARVGAAAGTVTVDAQPTVVPIRIELARNTVDQLVETRTTPAISGTTVTYPAQNARTRVIAQDVRNPANRPIFRYAQVDGTDRVLLPSTGTLSQAQRRSIRSVSIDLVVARDRGATGPAYELTTEVRIPNNRALLQGDT